ncbi:MULTISPECIES: DUF3471 domain-containing protein [Nostocales]|uniref:DUF3471 domain-containing protein n=2 Tax=Nostocales TaxID=1161 RepID=A0ABW8X0C8_9CYAN
MIPFGLIGRSSTPSHSLADYAGEYVHPAYGILKIEMKDSKLLFKLGRIQLPLTHFHYDRFDTPHGRSPQSLSY